jgi:hypothetical protein
VTNDLNWLTASQLAKGYRGRKFSPIDVAQAVLERIKSVDRAINAMCLVDEPAALAAAKASEKRWTRGKPKGPLDGVPVLIKDLLLSKGWPTLRGSITIDAKQAWNEDAPSVARLKEQGAVPIGKTTTPEFGWKGVTDSPLTGVTRNPWNPASTPGGSSGGSSAAVAAGVVPAAGARRAAQLSAEAGVGEERVEQAPQVGVPHLTRQVLEEAVELVQVAIGDREKMGRVHAVEAGAADRPQLDLELVAEALDAAPHGHQVAALELASEEVGLAKDARGDGAGAVAQLERQVGRAGPGGHPVRLDRRALIE